VVAVQMAYATSVLEHQIGYYASSSFYICWLLSCLCLGNVATRRLGSKRAIVCGALLLDVSFAMFAACAALGGDGGQGGLYDALAITSFVAGGLAAGLFWTGEGAYFARSAELVAESSGLSLESCTSSLAATFAAWNLAEEVVAKLIVSTLQSQEVAEWIPLALACAAALASTALMQAITEPLVVGDAAAPTLLRCATVRETVALWGDPNLWLLSMTNFTFGFSGAFLNGKINADYTKTELSMSCIGLMMALTACTAALVQRPYRMLADRCGKGVVLCIGAVSFLSIPCLTLVLPMSNIRWWLSVFYLFQGLGRGAYESTNRAVFADFYPAPRSEAAFANVAMQQAAAFSLAFAAAPRLGTAGNSMVLMVLASLIVPCFCLAHLRRERSLVGSNNGCTV